MRAHVRESAVKREREDGRDMHTLFDWKTSTHTRTHDIRTLRVQQPTDLFLG